MTKLHTLANAGQAIWLDYIRRSFMEGGELQQLVSQGLRGVTSNPTIFEKAIAGSEDYDPEIQRLAREGRSVFEIYDELSRADIQRAADILRPVYDSTGGLDGFVSLEVNPRLARDGQTTLEEALRLWQLVDRPNLMIKIPATRQGLPAITSAIAAGLNVNVTLIFSLQRYREVLQAYQTGLQNRLRTGKPIDKVASVASFFISRMDTKIDHKLQQMIQEEGAQSQAAKSLMGKAAIANAKLAYQEFLSFTKAPEFVRLLEHGGQLQRPLWASTSTKNPDYPDILYVQTLIGANTVNTLPEETLHAFVDHGEVVATLEENTERAAQDIELIEQLGISIEQVTNELEMEGVASFVKSFESLLDSLSCKREATLKVMKPSLELKNMPTSYDSAIKQLDDSLTIERLWALDHTLWKTEPTEISNRLGWLTIADEMKRQLPEIRTLVDSVRKEDYTQAVLLGMGGSSLAPEMFAHIFGTVNGYLQLSVLDSTDPAAVLAISETLDFSSTLFIVSTKSGTTEETLSFFKHFYNRMIDRVGEQTAGQHFIAITDPGTKLVELAKKLHFRSVFENNPNIGGRYSALSFFGLVPAALCGVDIGRMLERTTWMAESCAAQIPAERNPAAQLGVALGQLALSGKDKLTFHLPPALSSFGDWAEQLIAESTGKEGVGILPVVDEPLFATEAYQLDRVIVEIEFIHEAMQNQIELPWTDKQIPQIKIMIRDAYDIGAQLLLWEMATAIACSQLQVNPFDQPNVESAKKAARAMSAQFLATGNLPESGANLVVEAQGEGESNLSALAQFLRASNPGDYVAVQAFIQPTKATSLALREFRNAIGQQYRIATTVGYGPRFLHSTGQLHKGDSGNGLFIQICADHPVDVPIPMEAGKSEAVLSFGVLETSQALGDWQALVDAGRRVIRIHVRGDIPEGILKLVQALL